MSIELRTLVREAMSELPDANPRELAKQVVANTARRDLAGFYEETLVAYCADMLRESRNLALSQSRLGVTTAARARGTKSSPKVDAIREGFSRLCAERVHIGQGQWLQLGQCGVRELAFCIDERRQDVERIERRIRDYQRLIDLLGKHRARTVAELPPEQVVP